MKPAYEIKARYGARKANYTTESAADALEFFLKQWFSGPLTEITVKRIGINEPATEKKPLNES